MASLREWDESLKKLDNKSLNEIIKSLWVLKKKWPLFAKEYRTDLIFLSHAVIEERRSRKLSPVTTSTLINNVLA